MADLARGGPKKEEEVQDATLSNPVGGCAITLPAHIHKHLGCI